MKTDHVNNCQIASYFARPKLPVMAPDKLVKAKFKEGDRYCMTGWMLHLFLTEGDYYVEAYKEFRCKMMDLMYEKFSEDHASTPEQRSSLWNMTCESLGYVLNDEGMYEHTSQGADEDGWIPNQGFCPKELIDHVCGLSPQRNSYDLKFDDSSVQKCTSSPDGWNWELSLENDIAITHYRFSSRKKK